MPGRTTRDLDDACAVDVDHKNEAVRLCGADDVYRFFRTGLLELLGNGLLAG
jgi:hypothetical protein